MQSFAVLTFGCRSNQADSFALERELLATGGRPAPAECADVVVVNTCSVTAAADQAARQTIRRITRANRSARIIVTGCYATRRPADLDSLANRLRMVPNEAKETLAETVADAEGWQRAEGTAEGSGVPPVACRLVHSAIRPGYGGRTVAPLRIQTGCDESCSYCSIPSTRGPSRSWPLDAVLAEAHALASAGYKEVTLTGVHLGAYGRDLQPASSLLAALEALARLPADLTCRLSSLEPMDCSPAIVSLVASSKRFAPHFHLPLQHASDRLLSAMRRPYSLDDFCRVIGSIRRALPDAAIGSDVIVGFPGETKADHEVLAAFLAGSEITHLHVFPYSPRPGTAAERLGRRVPAGIVRQRCDELRAIARHLNRRFVERHVGHVLRGLTIEDGTRVVTDNYLKARLPPGHARNERVLVRVTSAEPLLGEVVA